jgi:gamma-glutamyl hercynylcysteine S-oxide synthase
MVPPTTTIPGRIDADELLAELADTRRRTLALVADIADEDLERVHDPIMSPLAWDLGHIAAYEDLWLCNRYAGQPLLRPELAALYDAFETPRAVRGDVPFLRPAECLEYLAAVRERAVSEIEGVGVGDGGVHEMVLQHEMQHTETMLQTLALARLDGYRPPDSVRPPRAPADAGRGASGLEMVEVPAGPFLMGAPEGRFSYDNERPRHEVQLPAFRIGRVAVTNGDWLEFVSARGYGRSEWWTPEGWAWKEEKGVAAPRGWTADGHEWSLAGCCPPDPHAPVVHVSWYEADAFARAHGARLPTEAEWEKAAVWDPRTCATRRWPWGDEIEPHPPANLDQRICRTVTSAAYPTGACPSGALGMIGDTWEWTASTLRGYPGFVAHPYKEYSEVFFGDGYKVLRGGSFATRARVATPTFRNWDLPQRRQLFAGVRIVKEVKQ